MHERRERSLLPDRNLTSPSGDPRVVFRPDLAGGAGARIAIDQGVMLGIAPVVCPVATVIATLALPPAAVFTPRSTVAERLRDPVDRVIAELYGRRASAPLWDDRAAARALELLRSVEREGLDARDYLPPMLELEPPEVVELAITAGVIAYAIDRRGRLDPRTLRPRRPGPAELTAIAATLELAARHRQLAAYAGELAQKSAEEEALAAALQRARRCAPGLTLPELPAMGAALAARTLEVNLERLRMRPRAHGTTRIAINLPAQSLTVHDGGEVVLEMRVIVGARDTPTPAIDTELREVTVNPTWTVPGWIARDELLPLIARDPGYLAAQHLRVFEVNGDRWIEVDAGAVDWSTIDPRTFRYRLRQDAGPTNALGRVRISAGPGSPIHLHDTPARNLFQRTDRTLSHGCIRLEDPLALAARLTGRSASKLRAMIEARESRSITLESPVPLRTEYRTAEWNEEAGVVLHPDIYDRDARLASALRALRDTHERSQPCSYERS